MKKPIKHECKSLKEFLKIERKYLRKLFYRKDIDRNQYNKYWFNWIYVDFIDLQLQNQQLLNYADKLYKKGNKNLKCILEEINKHYGFEFINKRDGKNYKLRGLEITNEDYYYVYIADDNSRCFTSCVGKCTDIGYYI